MLNWILLLQIICLFARLLLNAIGFDKFVALQQTLRIVKYPPEHEGVFRRRFII